MGSPRLNRVVISNIDDDNPRGLCRECDIKDRIVKVIKVKGDKLLGYSIPHFELLLKDDYDYDYFKLGEANLYPYLAYKFQFIKRMSSFDTIFVLYLIREISSYYGKNKWLKELNKEATDLFKEYDKEYEIKNVFISLDKITKIGKCLYRLVELVEAL